MKRSSTLSIGLSIAATVLSVTQVKAQTIGNWSTSRNDAGHAGVQKAETMISREKLANDFKFLWKLKLGNESGDYLSYSEPLLIFRLINSQGFKDFVIASDKQNVYAVDSELGKVLWNKHYEASPSTCGASNLPMIMEPPLVINFAARRAPGARPTPPAPPLSVGQRRVGVAAGGGGFGLKGIYVLTPDGYLHEQVITTGVDFAPPVKFVPGSIGVAKGLSLNGRTMYTSTASGCAGTKNALYAVDMSSPGYPVVNYDTKAVPQLTMMGPTQGEGLTYVVTGNGSSDTGAGIYANSVIALTPDAKVKSWYTPNGGGALRNVTPVAFTYKQKKLLLAPGKSGSFVLLDGEMPGGADHHTVIAETAAIGSSKSDTPDAIAVWQDSSGDAWVFASVQGALGSASKFGTSNGAVTHGSVVAFKIVEDGDKMSLAPQWTSADMVAPTPAVVANGLVIALAQGGSSTNAKLLVLDAATGKELYSSKSEIGTYARMAGISVGDGHVFFVTHDNTLYSFGIGIEH